MKSKLFSVVHKFLALIISFNLALPSPAFANREAATANALGIRSELRNDLVPLGVNTNRTHGISAGFYSRNENRLSVQSLAISEEDLKLRVLFGTNGVREFDMSPDNVRRIVDGVLKVWKEKASANGIWKEGDDLPWVGVGCDGRPEHGTFPDGFGYAKAAAETIAANGFEVRFNDAPIGSPNLIASTNKDYPVAFRNAIAIMITPSHNPITNVKGQLQVGVKVFMDNAPAPDAFTDLVSETINKNEYTVPTVDFADAVKEQKIQIIEDVNAPEWDRLNAVFDFRALGQKLLEKFPNLYVALNPMHGSMSEFAPQVYKVLGVPVKAFNTQFMNDPAVQKKVKGQVVDPKIDELVAWGPDPTQKHFRGQEFNDFAVEAARLIKFLIDGDADRLVSEEAGQEIIPNEIGMLGLYYLWKYKGERGLVARTVPTTKGLDYLLKALVSEESLANQDKYGKPQVTGVGSKLFLPFLDDLVIGVEESGHIAFRYQGKSDKKELFFDHSLALSLLLLEMTAETGKTFNVLLDEMWKFITQKTGQERLIGKRTAISREAGAPKYYDLVKDFRTKEPLRNAFQADLEAELKEKGFEWKVTNVDCTDKGGCEFQLDGGRSVMARKSGTDGSIRIYMEVVITDSEDLPAIVKDIYVRLLDKYLEDENRNELRQGDAPSQSLEIQASEDAGREMYAGLPTEQDVGEFLNKLGKVHPHEKNNGRRLEARVNNSDSKHASLPPVTDPLVKFVRGLLGSDSISEAAFENLRNQNYNLEPLVPLAQRLAILHGMENKILKAELPAAGKNDLDAFLHIFTLSTADTNAAYPQWHFVRNILVRLLADSNQEKAQIVLRACTTLLLTVNDKTRQSIEEIKNGILLDRAKSPTQKDDWKILFEIRKTRLEGFLDKLRAVERQLSRNNNGLNKIWDKYLLNFVIPVANYAAEDSPEYIAVVHSMLRIALDNKDAIDKFRINAAIYVQGNSSQKRISDLFQKVVDLFEQNFIPPEFDNDKETLTGLFEIEDAPAVESISSDGQGKDRAETREGVEVAASPQAAPAKNAAVSAERYVIETLAAPLANLGSVQNSSIQWSEMPANVTDDTYPVMSKLLVKAGYADEFDPLSQTKFEKLKPQWILAQNGAVNPKIVGLALTGTARGMELRIINFVPPLSEGANPNEITADRVITEYGLTKGLRQPMSQLSDGVTHYRFPAQVQTKQDGKKLFVAITPTRAENRWESRIMAEWMLPSLEGKDLGTIASWFGIGRLSDVTILTPEVINLGWLPLIAAVMQGPIVVIVPGHDQALNEKVNAFIDANPGINISVRGDVNTAYKTAQTEAEKIKGAKSAAIRAVVDDINSEAAKLLVEWLTDRNIINIVTFQKQFSKAVAELGIEAIVDQFRAETRVKSAA